MRTACSTWSEGVRRRAARERLSGARACARSGSKGVRAAREAAAGARVPRCSRPGRACARPKSEGARAARKCTARKPGRVHRERGRALGPGARASARPESEGARAARERGRAHGPGAAARACCPGPRACARPGTGSRSEGVRTARAQGVRAAQNRGRVHGSGARECTRPCCRTALETSERPGC